VTGGAPEPGRGWRLTDRRGFKLFKFLAAGLPSFVVAVPLNYLLVDRADLHTGVAYALVLLAQVSVNFFMCRLFVFERTAIRPPIVKEFLAFVAGMAVFRLADWVVYYVLVNQVGVSYLAVQLSNVVFFAVLKFLFAERVMKDGPPAATPTP
jgi:putative flippase GtrA